MADFSFGNYGNYGRNTYGNNDVSTTNYGAQGGAGGGGFMSGSQPQGSQGNANKWGRESLRPCTILQTKSAPDPGPESDFRIDDVEVGHVVVIGQIRNIAKQATNTTYVLDDGTGSIEAKAWTDAEKQTTDDEGNPLPQPASEQGLEVGRWAKCFGKLKQFSNKRHIGVNAIRAMTDMNEINAHLLEATAIHLHFTKGPPSGQDTAMKDEDGGLFVQQQGTGGGPSLVGFTPVAKKIYEFLKSAPESNEGYHSQHIAATLKIPLAEIKKAGDELQHGSIVYTTTDDDTWALLE